ncbi:MAG: 2Fe-2S iron-sulfur cluster-binding protein [Paracoccaceae bacterium]|nr:2Fe-2S iron-sulfur cluster-binding protein [Paracoccaceae bacterium]
MAKINSLPDEAEFETQEGETLLSAALRSGIAFAHACGGRARCSTCRVWVIDGLDTCPARTDAEQAMAQRLGLSEEVRLACQLRPQAELCVRRLVLDETDLMMASQLERAATTRAGETREVAVLFSDIAGFTAISETLSPYDVMYLLNRFFVEIGDVVERDGGYIDKFVGDGMMAIFGIDDQPRAPLRAIRAALRILDVADRVKPFFHSMYGIEFEIRVGLHYGEAVIGSIGSVGHERLTAIGDIVNVASRIEAANKDAGTRFLISEALHAQVAGQVVIADFVRVRLRGTSERITLYEVEALEESASSLLDSDGPSATMLYAGKEWLRLMPAGEIAPGERKIVALDTYDVVVLRQGDEFFAFNNACPHLNLPLFERRGLSEGDLGNYAGTDTPRPINSVVTEERGLVCRWHNSCFDLQTGEVRDWATRLNEDGTSPGWDFLGDISKNRAKLRVYPCRVQDGQLWVALD